MIKMFIGTSDTEDRWIEQIYLYSLFKNTKEKLDITFLRPKMFKDWQTNGWGTPFTCFRYAVPELMGFKGRAIYTDVDQLNFKDISELYEIDLEDRAFAMSWDGLHDNGYSWANTKHDKGWFCDSVMVIDCKKAKEFISPIEEIKQYPNNYKHSFIKKMGNPYRDIGEERITLLDPRWNSFDGRNTSNRPENDDMDLIPQFELDDIWHLHFTSLSTQPWHPIYTPWGKCTYPRQDVADLVWDYARKVKMISNPEEF